MDDTRASKFGLPPCLWVPIAAASPHAIKQFVGQILDERVRRDGRVEAMLIGTYKRPAVEDPSVQLWHHPLAHDYRLRLFPKQQVWVHVDYRGYRKAYIEFGMPTIPANYFLDHIQNREAIRLRDYSHPYLRLCPVARTINTSGGHVAGGEGMEKAFLRTRKEKTAEVQAEFRRVLQYDIQYADPMDLTKMLNIAPGTVTLPGVAEVQGLFYPQ
jgi:hypothetical protein